MDTYNPPTTRPDGTPYTTDDFAVEAPEGVQVFVEVRTDSDRTDPHGHGIEYDEGPIHTAACISGGQFGCIPSCIEELPDPRKYIKD